MPLQPLGSLAVGLVIDYSLCSNWVLLKNDIRFLALQRGPRMFFMSASILKLCLYTSNIGHVTSKDYSTENARPLLCRIVSGLIHSLLDEILNKIKSFEVSVRLINFCVGCELLVCDL
nr:unnamed protein product [Callosobruchus chinensis]